MVSLTVTKVLLLPLLQDEFLSQDEEDSHEAGTASDDALPPGSPSSRAEALLESGSFDKAIVAFSDALTECAEGRQRGTLLLGRSTAYCRLSKHLRSIPAAESEARALYAPDPAQLAASALRDADSALKMDSAHISAVHAARGDAMFLLERYNDAREAYRMALAHAPGQLQYACKLKECDEALSGGPAPAATQPATNTCVAAFKAIRAQALQDAECTLCLKLLYEPVTTPCGHTFCRPCFARSFDHTNKCPMCRTVLHVSRDLPATIVLKNMLENSFPAEYAARRAEEVEAAAVSSAANAATILPLFVMAPMLPGEKMALNIFEPRYRLMIRRVMEGGRKFGMATVNRNHTLDPVACEVEILECDPLPDGRFYVEILGRRRFRPKEESEQDGYRVARAEFITDEAPAPGSQEAAELDAVTVEVEAMAQRWAERMRSLAESRPGARELLRRVGDKPTSPNNEQLSFWVVSCEGPVDAAHEPLSWVTFFM